MSEVEATANADASADAQSGWDIEVVERSVLLDMDCSCWVGKHFLHSWAEERPCLDTLCA